MEMQVNVEIIEGNKYYSTVDAKGNSTMVFVWDGQMYIQTNSSPARCIEDVKRLSKTAKALIEYVSAIKEEKEGGLLKIHVTQHSKKLTATNQTTFTWLSLIK